MKVKQLVLFLIALYQGLELVKKTILYSVFGYQIVCKHRPTCSDYAVNQIQKNGTIAGLWRGFLRVASCW